MKKIVSHSIFLFFIFVTFTTIAQNNKIKGYRIEGDQVIFSFDIRDYQKVTHDGTQEILDFNDFDIKNVVVSGTFNDWSKDKWSMIKVNDTIYELRKYLTDFTDDFLWEFKFVINNTYWAEPSKDDFNISPAKSSDGYPFYTYNLKMYSAYPDINGNACFKLYGHTEATKVILAGSFNKWDEHIFSMTKTETGWELRLQLNPDEYEYKFIVDGNWINDESNPNRKLNEFDGYNSIINIKKSITFTLTEYLNADTVFLAGSFNDWSEHDFKMIKTTDGWEYTLLLSGGKHHYKFIVDGEWVLDPTNPVKEYDWEGNINSVYMVK